MHTGLSSCSSITALLFFTRHLQTQHRWLQQLYHRTTVLHQTPTNTTPMTATALSPHYCSSPDTYKHNTDDCNSSITALLFFTRHLQTQHRWLQQLYHRTTVLHQTPTNTTPMTATALSPHYCSSPDTYKHNTDDCNSSITALLFFTGHLQTQHRWLQQLYHRTTVLHRTPTNTTPMTATALSPHYCSSPDTYKHNTDDCNSSITALLFFTRHLQTQHWWLQQLLYLTSDSQNKSLFLLRPMY